MTRGSGKGGIFYLKRLAADGAESGRLPDGTMLTVRPVGEGLTEYSRTSHDGRHRWMIVMRAGMSEPVEKWDGEIVSPEERSRRDAAFSEMIASRSPPRIIRGTPIPGMPRSQTYDRLTNQTFESRDAYEYYCQQNGLVDGTPDDSEAMAKQFAPPPRPTEFRGRPIETGIYPVLNPGLDVGSFPTPLELGLRVPAPIEND